MEVGEFVRRLKNSIESFDSRYTFFLGAGCSLSSGVPTAAELVKLWLPKLKRLQTGSEVGLEDWTRANFPEYSTDRAGAYYGEVMGGLFRTPEERQREIQRLVEGKDPGFGYAVLAKLISHDNFGRHCNVVLTTNFDDMVADAMYLYSSEKPLVLGHDSLFGFLRISRTRPVVLKLHGDARLAPRNTGIETQQLDAAVKRLLTTLLSETGIVFMGYGGNDSSIVDLLKDIPENALPWGLFWVGRQLPDGPMGEWLRKRNATLVNHLDFDQLMLLVLDEFQLPHPSNRRFDQLLGGYFRTFAEIRSGLNSVPVDGGRKTMEAAIENAANRVEDVWSVVLRARFKEETDPAAAAEIYREGAVRFAHSAVLFGNYAQFMRRRVMNYDAAEKLYEKAIELDPNNARNLGAYALFLADIKRDYAEAERYYRRSLQAEPNNFSNLVNFAGFLFARGQKDEAQEILLRFFETTYSAAAGLEARFYLFAHSPDPEVRLAAKAAMAELLAASVRSPGWNLQNNVIRAIEDGHPEPEVLQHFAAMIAQPVPKAREASR
jgi:tetratricopeptide (TPR) repeat protein